MSKVSIVIPSYNSEQFIERSILSVVRQTYKNWELIIVDDCSTDKTLSIVDNVLKKNQIIANVIKNKENLGADKSRNIGIEISSGSYIAFLDSDDCWNKNKLTKQVEFMKETDSKFSCTSYIVNDKNGKKYFNFVPFEASSNDILKNNTISTSTIIYDCLSLGKIYMPAIKKGQDLALWLKILDITGKVHGLNEPLTNYFKRSKSLSSNKFESAIWVWYLLRNIRKLSYLHSLYYFIFYFFNGIRKHYFPKKSY